MNVYKYFAVCGAILFIAGCVRSLYPLFTENDLVFRSELIGTWSEQDGKNTWTFEKSGEKDYVLRHYENEFEVSTGEKVAGDTAIFVARLGKLGRYLFLDIYPGKPETKVKNGYYNFHLLPVHTILRVWLESDTLKLSMLDNDWLAKMIDNNSYSIKHARLNDQLILTASTRELQRLVTTYAENKKAFPTPGVLRRVK